MIRRRSAACQGKSELCPLGVMVKMLHRETRETTLGRAWSRWWTLCRVHVAP